MDAFFASRSGTLAARAGSLCTLWCRAAVGRCRGPELIRAYTDMLNRNSQTMFV